MARRRSWVDWRPRWPCEGDVPDVPCVGIADGAKGNWEFLERHTEAQVVDFWHAAEYLGKAAAVLYRVILRRASRGWTRVVTS